MNDTKGFDVKAERAKYREAKRTIRDIEKRARAALREQLQSAFQGLHTAQSLATFSDELGEFLAERD